MGNQKLAEIFPNTEFEYGLMHKEKRLFISDERLLTDEMSEAMSFKSKEACELYGSLYIGNFEEFQIVIVND